MNRQHASQNTGFTRIEFVILLAIVGGLFALLYPVLQRTRNPKGPIGETYPSTTPNEANRVTHATGLSIIVPENWDEPGPETSFLRIAARGTPGRRLKSVITVRQCAPEPQQQTLDRCRRIQFQDLQAYEICHLEREDSFDDPPGSSYDLYVQRKGVWWHVNYLIADKMNILPNSIRQYIATIEFPDP